eukprot:178458-Heterocapsa_arctica.AAC.1
MASGAANEAWARRSRRGRSTCRARRRWAASSTTRLFFQAALRPLGMGPSLRAGGYVARSRLARQRTSRCPSRRGLGAGARPSIC